MGWSLKLGKWFGIEVRVHATFLLLLLFVFLAGFSRGGATPAVFSVAFICAIFVCVLIHELTHSLIARRFGKQARAITLLPIGGVATIEELPDKPLQEIVISLMGPLINLAIAGVLYLVLGRWTGVRVPGLYPESFRELFASLIGANIVLAIFNLVPAFPMDGGRVLRGILALKMDFVRATATAVAVGQAFAALFIFYGLFYNWLLGLIGVFILFGAGGEKREVMIRAALRRIPAREAMATQLQALKPDETLGDALDYLQHRCQDDFPVISDKGLEGILNRSALLTTIRQKGLDAHVSEVMDVNYGVISPEIPLDEVYRQFAAQRKGTIAVEENNELRGLLALDNVSRYLMIQVALGRVEFE